MGSKLFAHVCGQNPSMCMSSRASGASRMGAVFDALESKYGGKGKTGKENGSKKRKGSKEEDTTADMGVEVEPTEEEFEAARQRLGKAKKTSGGEKSKGGAGGKGKGKKGAKA